MLVERLSRGILLGTLGLAGALLPAQGPGERAGARAWAEELSRDWTELKYDARGQRIRSSRKLGSLPPAEQVRSLLAHLDSGPLERRAALVLLGQRPLAEWAPQALDAQPPAAAAHNPRQVQRQQALRQRGARDEVAHFLWLRSYRAAGADPYAYLDPAREVGRPWTHGLGLHLEPGTWRFQWIPSPVLMPRLEDRNALPGALEGAPVPSALLRLKELRPGLARLRSLAGAGITGALARGTRAGFLLRHVEAWFAAGAPVLEGLAHREAWILHYAAADAGGWGQEGLATGGGTLVFLPGELPARTRMALAFLKLNPASVGARARTVTWKARWGGGSAEVTQVRASGGVLNLATVPGGTWLCDREAPLRALLFPAAQVQLSERREWCRAALAGLSPTAEASLWVLPRQGGGAAFERLAIRRCQLNAPAPTWPNPFIAKAAPRTGALALALGAGPTEHLLAAFLRLDDPGEIPLPEAPPFADAGARLSPQQKRELQAAQQRAEGRRAEQKALRAQVQALDPLLDPRGAALFSFGWTPPPPLSEADRARMAEYRRLRREAPVEASRMQREGRAGFFGGFGEPGLSPSLALAVPLKEGKGAQADEALGRLFPRLFKGSPQVREVAGATLHRVRTAQAFAPTWTIVKDTLVLASDDRAAEQVVQGLLGQAPTLADLSSTAYGRAEVDGARLAGDLEQLLLAYLRTRQPSGRPWWEPADPALGADEAAAEVAEAFGPFLGALRGLGRVQIELTLGPGGLEARPR